MSSARAADGPSSRGELQSSAPAPLPMSEMLFYRDLVLAGFEPSWQHSVSFLEVDGRLDAARVEWCVQALLSAHPATRSRLVKAASADTVPEKYVAEIADAAPLVVLRSDDERLTHTALNALVDAPFDLTNESARFGLSVGRRDTSYVAFAFPHLFSDQHSLRVLTRDFLALYDGRAEPQDLGGPTIIEYSADQQAAARDGRFHSGLAYWEDELGGAQAVIESALGDPAAIPTPPTFDVLEAPETWPALWGRRCSEARVSPSALLLGALAAGVQSVTGRDDVTMQIVFDPRRGPFQDTIGHLSDRIFMRVPDSSRATEAASLHQIQLKLVRAMMRALPAVYMYDHLPDVFPRWHSDQLPGCDLMVNLVDVSAGRPDPQGAVAGPALSARPVALRDRTGTPQTHAGITLMLVVLYGRPERLPIYFLWGPSTVTLEARGVLRRAVLHALARIIGVESPVDWQ